MCMFEGGESDACLCERLLNDSNVAGCGLVELFGRAWEARSSGVAEICLELILVYVIGDSFKIGCRRLALRGI